MGEHVAIVGFGEAGQALATCLIADFRTFDIKTESPATAVEKRDDYARLGVRGCGTLSDALAGAVAALSLVTADQALGTAQAAAPRLSTGAFWFDMNSVAPGTKRDAAHAIDTAGGRYVDVAVMAPVQPARCAVALLVSGPHSEDGAELLRRLGFCNVRVVSGEVGLASSIKMIRSVMVKGIEALTAECVLAADRAGVLDEVLASLDASPPPVAWWQRADHNLDRMMVHGLRRAAEMQEVTTTLEALGVPARLSRGTTSYQREIGAIGLIDPPSGLLAKVALLNSESAG